MKQSGLPPDQIKEQVAKLVNGYSEAMMPLFESHKKPLVGYTFQNVRDPLVKFLIDRGVPIFSGPQRGARAIEAAALYTRLREKILSDLPEEGRDKLDSE
ncbi:MAG: hypothetical protein FJ107_06380 [Deltaproteobacteria bacterium]|nr:hypothetical protein [Deltaproteobacteria bacterium]